MKNLNSFSKHALSTLFLFFAFLMIAEAQNYSQVVRENGLVMQRIDSEHVGKINYIYSETHDLGFIYMRATKDDFSNNCILTKEGLLRVNDANLCRDDDSEPLTAVDPSVKLYVNGGEHIDGDLFVNGNTTKATGDAFWDVASDERLKKNVNSLKNSLATLKEVEFVEFQYNGLAETPTDKKYYGVLAQQVGEVIPSTVKTFSKQLQPSHKNKTELLMFNPNDLVYTGLNAIKELAVITEEQHQELVENLEEEKRKNRILENRIDDLENKLEQLISSLPQNESSKEVSYSNSVFLSEQGSSGQLHQNIPNPLNQSTLIKYDLPTVADKASILIQDTFGRVLHEMILPNNVKNGSAEFNAAEAGLKNGTYIYTLVVNGQHIDSKKMILVK